MSFISELKRRNVIRVGGLYLVGAWVFAQIAETILPVFHTPEWVLQTIIVLLGLGFVPALIFAWVFELTPDGLKRDSEVVADNSVAPHTARRIERMIIALVAVALIFFAFDKFVLAPKREAALVAQATKAVKAEAVNAEAVAEPKVATARGIAVMPFDNLSPDPDNAFFAGGVFEEVLTKLSQVPELRVISRTSMEQIAKQGLEVSDIGKRLGVSHVLEGSVRRAGDRVRVTVQLIEAATDNHLWAENYDRKLDDVFAIQSEIAIAIADQLKITLSKQLQADLSERPTQNQAAYDLYLRAVAERTVWRADATFRAMIALLEPAVQMDPNFLPAQVLLSEAYGRMYWFGEDPDGSYVTKARALVTDIKQRFPGRLESDLAQAQFLYNVNRDYEGALAKYRAAEARLPNNRDVVSGISSSLKRLARYREQLPASRRWLTLDPESSTPYNELGFALVGNGMDEEALALAEEASGKFPEDESTAGWLAHLKLALRSDIKPLLEFGQRFKSVAGANDRTDELTIARFVAGDVDGALAGLAIRSDNPLLNASAEGERAELLRLAGRDAEAKSLAAHAYSIARKAIAAGDPAPRGMKSLWYANAAAIAALAGETEAALSWQKLSLATPVPSLDEGKYRIRALAAAQRRLGNQEAAWLLLKSDTDPLSALRDGELLAFKPYYDKLYGESPSYRAYLAKIAKTR